MLQCRLSSSCQAWSWGLWVESCDYSSAFDLALTEQQSRVLLDKLLLPQESKGDN